MRVSVSVGVSVSVSVNVSVKVNVRVARPQVTSCVCAANVCLSCHVATSQQKTEPVDEPPYL